MPDMEQGYSSTGDEKDNAKRYQRYIAQEQEMFVKKSYWLCLLLFIVVGVVMVAAVVGGMYKDVLLAESFMVSILGTIYWILFIIMLCCYGSPTLRIATLLFVSTFIGLVAVFMVGINLKMVVSHLKDN